MVSLAKLLRIRQGIGEKYKNLGLEKFLLSITCKQASQLEMKAENPLIFANFAVLALFPLSNFNWDCVK
jgi:hypothetical protein